LGSFFLIHKVDQERKKRFHSVLLSLPLSILGLLTVFRALETVPLIDFQTVYRITYPERFLFYITGNFLFDDVVIVLAGIASALVIFYQKKRKTSWAIVIAPGVLISLAVILQNIKLADIAALSVLPSILASHFVIKRMGRIKEDDDIPARITANSLVITLVGILLAIESASLISWILYPAFPSKLYSGWQWYGAEVDSNIFSAFGMLSPILAVLIAFSFGIKPSMQPLKLWLEKVNERKGKQDKNENQDQNATRGHNVQASSGGRDNIAILRTGVAISSPLSYDRDGTLTKRKRWLFLSISSALVLAFSAYPYLPSINPNFQNESVDAPYYVNQINVIRNGGLFSPSGPFGFTNERALSILVFYAITAPLPASIPLAKAVAFLPAFLGLLSVFSAYYLVRYVFGPNSRIVLLAPLLTAMSSQFIVGIYGGFFSNMLAFPFLFLSILYFMKYLDSDSPGKKRVNFSVFMLASMLTLLSHVYTWAFLAGTLAITMVILTLTRYSPKGAVARTRRQAAAPFLPVIAGIALSVLALVAVAFTLKTSTSGVGFISSLASSGISGDYFAKRWFNVDYMFRIYLGGFLTNSALLMLALIWALKADYKNHFNAILLSSMFITSFFFFFGDTELQSRIFLNIPMQIPAAVVLGNIASGKYLGAALGAKTRMLLVLLVVVHFANYDLRSLANMYLAA
jgi:hypothetical protein